MRLLRFTPRYLQAAEREEDVLPRDAGNRPELQGAQIISTIDPITCQDVGDIEGKAVSGRRRPDPVFRVGTHASALFERDPRLLAQISLSHSGIGG